jgi:hypothetical protein
LPKYFGVWRERSDYIVSTLLERHQTNDPRDLDVGLALLSYARHDLNALVEKIPAGELIQPRVGNSENPIAKILDHVAWAEWWYFNRLDVGFPRSEMPQVTRAKIDVVRDQTRALLPDLVGETRVLKGWREMDRA